MSSAAKGTAGLAPRRNCASAVSLGRTSPTKVCKDVLHVRWAHINRTAAPTCASSARLERSILTRAKQVWKNTVGIAGQGSISTAPAAMRALAAAKGDSASRIKRRRQLPALNARKVSIVTLLAARSVNFALLANTVTNLVPYSARTVRQADSIPRRLVTQSAFAGFALVANLARRVLMCVRNAQQGTSVLKQKVLTPRRVRPLDLVIS